MKKFVFLLLMFSFILTGCGEGDSGGGNNTNAAMTQLNCTGVTAFDPAAAGLFAQTTAASGTPKNTTIILLHGKTGSPYSTHLSSFQTDMAALGYKVIAPSMTWSTTTWNGSLCEGMTYINELIATEKNASQDVVLIGHSMGGAYSVMYGVTQPNETLKAIVTIAPGHFMHLSNNLQSTTAADITRAKGLESNGMGDVLDTFITLNNGSSLSLSTTATRYLSFHDLDRVPAITQFAANISSPVLWLSGNSDSLTTNQDHAGLASLITSNKSEYQLLSANHTSIVAITPSIIDTWISGL